MDKEDARKLSPEQQKEKRKIALRMRTNGRKFTEIGEIVGVHPRTVQHWWSRYQAEGVKAAIEGGKRGTAFGKRRTLNVEQEWVVRGTAVNQRKDARSAQVVLRAVDARSRRRVDPSPLQD